jgi:hypothetical protein
MIRTILTHGAIGALIVAIPMIVGMTLWPVEEGPAGGAVVGYATILVALTLVFLGVKRHRDKALGGVIRFLPAFGIGLAISAVASLGWVIGWEISLALTGFDFGAVYSEMMVEKAREAGASEAELAKALADAQAFATMYANPLMRMPITFVEMFPIGVIVSLLTAGLLRNSRFMPARGGRA